MIKKGVTFCPYFNNFFKILPGGEGESEEDEDEEPAADLKKPNSDEVRAIRNRPDRGVSDWLMG